MTWRTKTSGNPSRLRDYGRSEERITHGCKLEEFPEDEFGDIRKRERSKVDRYCPECGSPVCTYKDPKLRRNVFCYAHDHLSQWTRQYILDEFHVDRSSPCYNRGTERGPVE